MPYKTNTTAQLYFYARDNVTGVPTAGLVVSASRALSAAAIAAVDGTLTSVGDGRWRFSASATDMNAAHVGLFFVATSMVPVCLNIKTQASAEILTAQDVSAAAKQAIADYDPPTAGEITTLSANIATNVAAVSAAISARAKQALADYDAPTAAEITTLSANLNTNIGAVSAGVANASAGLETHLVNISAALTNVSAAVVAVSAAISVKVQDALDANQLHMLVGASASTTAVHDNSLIAMLMASADANAYSRTTDSLAAIADGAGAVPLTSAATSGIVAGALTNYTIPTSANMETRFTNVSAAVVNVSGAVAAVSALILTSAEQSAIAGNAVTNSLTAYDVPTSADVSAIVLAVTTAGSGITSAQASAIVRGIVPVALTNFYSGVETGAAVSATAGGIQLRVSAASAATHLNNFIYIYTASGATEVARYANGMGQMRFITTYTTATKWAGVNKNWDITPSGASYVIIPAQAMSAEVVGSAEISAIMQAALTNYPVLTSANVSAIAGGAITNASLATSANVSVATQAIYNLSASMSALVAGVITNAAVATSAVVAGVSAAISGHVAQALTDHDVLTSGDLPVKANIVQIAGSSADAQTMANSLTVVFETSASGTPTTTVIPTELTAAQMPDDDWLVGRIVTFRGGALDGQQVEITGATSAGNITVTTCTRAPLDGQAMIIT